MIRTRNSDRALASSFRDPSGVVFRRDGVVYRQVNSVYRQDFEALLESGLYDELVAARLLIPHTEVSPELALSADAYKVIRPEPLGFVSYPYEWCPSQLRDAALTTLAVQERALAKGLWLKDASAFNIQFHHGRPLLVDTLSFARRPQGEPWPAYRQFCEHFLGPLALMTQVDVRLGQLFRANVAGIPLELASRLLPRSSWLRPALLMHLHLHARAQRRYSDTDVRARRGRRRMSQPALIGLLQSLRGEIGRLRWREGTTPWRDYEREHGYGAQAFEAKERLVEAFLDRCSPAQLWDLGANAGSFSRIASVQGISTVAFDLDAGAVEANYHRMSERGETEILPLLMDLTNPSPAIGWSNAERESLLDRGPVDVVMALALVHHLSIGNNVPFTRVAEFMARLGKWLIIEFVPKHDPQVQRLLRNRTDIFEEYNREQFEAAFADDFSVRACEPVGDSGRLLYLMKNENEWAN